MLEIEITENIPYKLYDWVYKLNKNNTWDQYSWDKLCQNPKAIRLLEENPEKIDWDLLSLNPNAIHILERNPDKINWSFLSKNPSAIHLLERNPDKINWSLLSMNPNAMHLLEKNHKKVVWGNFLKNPNPNAIRIIENHIRWSNMPFYIRWPFHVFCNRIKNIDWKELSCNPNAIHLIEQNFDKIKFDYWICYYLSLNPNAVPFLEKHPELIEWNSIWINPNAIPLLNKNMDKIDYNYLSMNPNALQLDKNKLFCLIISYSNPCIFTYDYDAMRESYKELKQEIIQEAWHPRRIAYRLEAGMDIEDM
jgi:hypothetical protein